MSDDSRGGYEGYGGYSDDGSSPGGADPGAKATKNTSTRVDQLQVFVVTSKVMSRDAFTAGARKTNEY
eukprot:4885221-Pyramimonas_sp.AAC.1